MFVFAPCALAQQQSTPTPTPNADATTLEKIEFVGLKRVKQEEALAATGLQVGQAVDVDVVDAAASRLAESGLFQKLSYNYRAAKSKASVLFTVEETMGYSPVVFDNFIWFSDRELNEYVRKNIPGFDGTAPESGTMVENIRRVLEGLLTLRGIEGRVEYTPSADPAGRNPEHLFTVRGARLRVCSIKYPGASALKEETLVQHSAGILSTEYSRQFVRAFAESNLAPLYRERGLLRAAFRTPQARPEETEECNGVALTIPVDEGSTYVWGSAEWTGNEALASEELSAALGMRQREIANVTKIDKGLEDVRHAYARKGHLAARLTATPVFDDAARSVTYSFAVNEGPQYRMGEFQITGLSEKDTNNLKGRWSLLPREVYDADYLSTFIEKTVAEFLRDPTTEARALGPLKIEASIRPDREKLTVDVTINFKPQQKLAN
jgi:outer membrane protein assembly factor BamA